MPEYPNTGGDWTNWIIGTLMTVITAVVGTAVTLAKAIESKYQQEVTDLRNEMTELRKESKACQDDRYALAIRVASLESQQKKEDNGHSKGT